MKKIFTTTLALISCSVIFGQSLHLFHHKKDVTNGEIIFMIHPDTLTELDLSISNTTDKSFNYQVNRTVLTPPIEDCAALFFCSGNTCYSPSWDNTWGEGDDTDPVAIKAFETMPNKDSTYGVYAHYNVCPTSCKDMYVKYRVYNIAAGTKDTAYVTIKYTCATGITKQPEIGGYLSAAYPNPADANFSLNYQLERFSKSEIALYNVVGKKVQEIALSEKEGIVTINTAQLTPGIYFYSLVVNNRPVTTKKIIVKKL